MTSPVLGPPESSRSRALVARAGLEIRQPSHGTSRRIGNINCWFNHYAQSKLCYMLSSKNGWLNDVRSCVSIQQNCQELRRNFGESFCAVDMLGCQAVKPKPTKCGPHDAILLLTHLQVFPFNIIIMYMGTKYTGLLSIISQSSFPWCKNYGPRTVPISCRCQQHRSDYNPVLWHNMYDIRMYRHFPRGQIWIWYNYIIL